MIVRHSFDFERVIVGVTTLLYLLIVKSREKNLSDKLSLNAPNRPKRQRNDEIVRSRRRRVVVLFSLSLSKKKCNDDEFDSREKNTTKQKTLSLFLSLSLCLKCNSTIKSISCNVTNHASATFFKNLKVSKKKLQNDHPTFHPTHFLDYNNTICHISMARIWS